MKGIILAGGTGSRLYPITKIVNKQSIPIYDKPMIYYPLSVLMEAEIQDILVISTPEDQPKFEELLGDGSQFGINLSYAIQPSPDGLAQAFTIGEEFIGNDTCAMILGDNIFHSSNLKNDLMRARENAENGRATIFGYHVNDPQRFGIVEFDENGKVLSVEEKPENPKSKYAITGLYFYDNSVVEKAKRLKPSARGELEITDLNRLFLEEDKLDVITMNAGYSWFDTGTHDSLAEATLYVYTIQKRQNLSICCPEEIGFKNGWITKEQLLESADSMRKNGYGAHLSEVANAPVKKLILGLQE